MCRRAVVLEQYQSKPTENLKKHLCCDICAIKCEYNEVSCKLFIHPYLLSKENECDLNEFDNLGLESSNSSESESDSE